MNALTGAVSAVGLPPLPGHDRRRLCVCSRRAGCLEAHLVCLHSLHVALIPTRRVEVACHVSKQAIKQIIRVSSPPSLFLKNLQVQTCECAHGKYKETGKGTLTFRSGNSSRWAPYCWPPSPVNPVRTSAGSPIHSHFLDTPFQP